MTAVDSLFTSKERDAETGLDYFGARYMSSAQGRITSPDIAGPDLNNPQTLNRYRDGLDNPLRYVDRNGLYETDVHLNLTYSLALAAGIESGTAQRIADADQRIDTNPATGPVKGGIEARAKWHFTDPSVRDGLWGNFLDTRSPEALGMYLHTEQDSYSHEGLGPNLGQTVTWPWKITAVDKTYNDPEKADRMAVDTFSHLLFAAGELGGVTGLDAKIVSPYVNRFNRAKSDSEKQKILNELNGVAQANQDRQKSHGNDIDAGRQCAMGNAAACGFGR